MIKRKWTTEDLQFMRDNCTKLTNAELAAALGRTQAAIKRMNYTGGFNQMREKSTAYQLLLKRKSIERAKRCSTVFQKQMVPHNVLPELSVRRAPDMVYIKYKGKFRDVRHAIYMANTGKEMPPNHIVRSVDGNYFNMAFDNLQVIHKRENLSLNAVFKSFKTSDLDLFKTALLAVQHKYQLNLKKYHEPKEK
jgi:hypothetical protein